MQNLLIIFTFNPFAISNLFLSLDKILARLAAAAALASLIFTIYNDKYNITNKLVTILQIIC